MTPITPHFSEEIWHRDFNTYVSCENYPKYNEKEIYEKEEVGEYLLSKVVDDTSEILKVTKIKPKKIIIYTSPSWKKKIYKKAIGFSNENKLNVGKIIKETISDPKLKSFGKQIAQFVNKLPSEIMKLNENDKRRYQIEINEYDYLKKSSDYLKDVFSSDVEIYDTDEKDIYDPGNKTRFSIPLRPAIFIE
jgi:leucyl-tRNA synthetase